MAASKGYYARANYRFLSTDRAAPIGSDSVFELDETDIWNVAASPELRKPVPSSWISRKSSSPAAAAAKRGEIGGTASSLPVNVPDWSKILKEDYTVHRRNDEDDENDDGTGAGDGDWIPPHEFLARQLARTRIASFSVHEGIGRTLKGRDLSRVRNAIWEKTGFED